MLDLGGVLLSSKNLNEKITLISSVFLPALTFPVKILLRAVVWEVRIEKTKLLLPSCI